MKFFSRLQIHYSIFNIQYSLSFTSLAFHLSFLYFLCSFSRHLVPTLAPLSPKGETQPTIAFMKFFSRLQIHYSIFNIRYSIFSFPHFRLSFLYFLCSFSRHLVPTLAPLSPKGETQPTIAFMKFFSRLQIHYSIFNIRYSIFSFPHFRLSFLYFLCSFSRHLVPTLAPLSPKGETATGLPSPHLDIQYSFPHLRLTLSSIVYPPPSY